MSVPSPAAKTKLSLPRLLLEVINLLVIASRPIPQQVIAFIWSLPMPSKSLSPLGLGHGGN